jgi:predicted dehydrogenase
MHRRRFLQIGAASGLGYWFTAHAVSADKAGHSPNGTLHFAGIGVGGKGSSDIDNASEFGDVIALCDIDEHRLGSKAEKFTSAKRYFDYRKMFDEMAKQIDAVTVSTPDHTHAPASMMAMKLGKHVYCQKPLTHTVAEARMMRETAKKMGLATQMGNQGTALDGLRRAVEIVQAGLLGQVTEAHVWTNRPVWPQAPKVTSRPPEVPVPAHVHWEEFIGSAPMRPYAEYDKGLDKNGKPEREGAYHAFNWRGWWDFGTGALGDMACHTANMAFMALKLGSPTSVVAEVVEGFNPETYPAGARVVFQFPARGNMTPVTFTWYEGKQDGKKLLPREELTARAIALDPSRKRIVNSGCILVGKEGMIYSPSDYGAEVLFDPPEKFKELNTKKPEKLPSTTTGDVDLAMKKEWVDAIKGGPPAMSNFDYAAMLTETILLGNIAMRFRSQELQWNPQTMKFSNFGAADKFVTKAYRSGWGV